MKFIRDIINEKRHASHAAAPVGADSPLEPKAAQGEALDLGAYLQKPVALQDPVSPEADASAVEELFADAGYDEEDGDTGYDDDSDDDGAGDDAYDDGYDDGYDDVDGGDEDNAPTGAMTGRNGQPAGTGQAVSPMDALFAQKIAPGAAPETDTQSASDYEDDAAEFFAGAKNDDDDTEDDADNMEHGAQDMPSRSASPASIAQMRRAMASERSARRIETSGDRSVATAGTDDALMHMPAPAPGRGSSRSGRVKTRLLGFTPGTEESTDPIARAEKAGQSEFAVGWVVVIDGPGRGASFTLYDGVSRIGRGGAQAVSLNFGDNAISRDNHVSIAYDGEANQFFIGHSGKANLVRVNSKPLLSTEEIHHGDTIRLGETTLRLIALCGKDFSWDTPAQKDARYA